MEITKENIAALISAKARTRVTVLENTDRVMKVQLNGRISFKDSKMRRLHNFMRYAASKQHVQPSVDIDWESDEHGKPVTIVSYTLKTARQ